MDVLAEIMLLLTVALPAAAKSCNATNGTTAQCFAALGEPVFLHFITDLKNKTFRLVKDQTPIQLSNKIKTEFHERCKNKMNSLINGTFKLCNVVKNDSGIYNFEVHDVFGKLHYEAKIQLNIEALLPKPELSQLCLPHGEMRVSCSSQDEYTELKWTLENQNLDRTVAYLSSQRDTVILKENVSGALGCEVRNHVSNNTNTLQIVPCPGLDTAVTLWCISSNGTEVSFTINAARSRSVPSITRMFFSFHGEDPALFICNSRTGMQYPTDMPCLCAPAVIVLMSAALAVFIAAVLLARTYCLHVRTTRHHSPPSSPQSDQENVPEPVYTQVSVRKKKKSPATQQAAPEEVQYGQVKLNEHDTLSDSLAISVYTVVGQ